MFRISWEMVRPHLVWKYSDPEIPNSQIPEADWYRVQRETQDPWEQFRQLRAWAEADVGFVRNVRLEEAEEPVWLEVARSAS